jgi:hypothetical protein
MMVLWNLKPAVVVPIEPYWIKILEHYYIAMRSRNTDGTTVWDWLARDYNAHYPHFVETVKAGGTRILVFENDEDAVLFKLRFA